VRSVSEVLAQDDICGSEPESVFEELVEINLDEIRPAHAGPFSPDRVTRVEGFRNTVNLEKWPREVSAVLLGSCTNSSYSDLYAAAQVLEEAASHGLKARVPFMLSPGSQQVYETIKRDGILEKLTKAGAVVLTASCGPCIGQWDRKDVKKGVPNCLFTTFNRNFRGRNDSNPETRAFLTSPQMAAALAVAGDAGFNPEEDPLIGTDGLEFKLKPPNPPQLPEKGMENAKAAFVPPPTDGRKTEIKIEPESQRLEVLEAFGRWDGKDFIDLPILIKTRGKTTTDHISPGGKWLRFRGHLSNISKNMLEGAVNAFTGETGQATNIFTGEKGVKLPDLAAYYKSKTGGFVIVGDDNYGEGSSREHAAMTPRFMGAKAVIARSFARIHEANLKKQGILPLTFRNPKDYDKVGEFDQMSFVELAKIRPGKKIKVILKGRNGKKFELHLAHTMTEEQIEWFKAGSALNTLREET
jgi:aconitate hydratase